MRKPLNSEGQPNNSRFNSLRRADRDIAEMLGLLKGVLADGVVTEAEATLLREWTRAHPDAVSVWPGNVLAARLTSIFLDGVVDKEEQADLADLLAAIVGGNAGVAYGQSTSTDLPLTQPEPDILLSGHSFVLTGKFAMGPRSACERLVVDRNGHCLGTVTKSLDFLVIGEFGSRDWIQSSHGRKIEKAVSYQNEGSRIAIVSEQHWAKFL